MRRLTLRSPTWAVKAEPHHLSPRPHACPPTPSQATRWPRPAGLGEARLGSTQSACGFLLHLPRVSSSPRPPAPSLSNCLFMSLCLPFLQDTAFYTTDRSHGHLWARGLLGIPLPSGCSRSSLSLAFWIPHTPTTSLTTRVAPVYTPQKPASWRRSEVSGSRVACPPHLACPCTLHLSYLSAWGTLSPSPCAA